MSVFNSAIITLRDIEVLMAVGIKITVVWDVTSFILVDGDQHFVQMEVASSSEALVHSVTSQTTLSPVLMFSYAARIFSA
jgi:hypothetical protein